MADPSSAVVVGATRPVLVFCCLFRTATALPGSEWRGLRARFAERCRALAQNKYCAHPEAKAAIHRAWRAARHMGGRNAGASMSDKKAKAKARAKGTTRREKGRAAGRQGAMGGGRRNAMTKEQAAQFIQRMYRRWSQKPPPDPLQWGPWGLGLRGCGAPYVSLRAK